MARTSRYEIDMCSGKLLPKILTFALPLMCSSVLQLLFNAADIVVVGKFAGDNSLAAVGSNAALINLMVNLFVGLSVGANILAARYTGAGNREGLRQTVHTSMLLALLSGILLAVVGVITARPLLHLMQVPDSILPLAALYLRIYFLGMPAAMLYNFGAALLRSVGDTRRPLYYLIAAGVVNVALNLLLVIVFQLDVAGVAIATVVSQCLSAFLVVRCLMHEEGDIRLELRELRITLPRLGQILEIGIPSGIQGVAFSLSNVIIQASINGFGETVISGNTAASNIEGFIYVACNAFCQANMAFTSQNYGAGKLERLKPIALCSAACSASVAVIGGMLVLALRAAAAAYLLQQRHGGGRRYGAHRHHVPPVHSVRPDGRDRGLHPGHRLFHHSHDRHAAGRLRLPGGVDRHRFPRAPVPHAGDHLLVVPHLVGADVPGPSGVSGHHAAPALPQGGHDVQASPPDPPPHGVKKFLKKAGNFPSCAASKGT